MDSSTMENCCEILEAKGQSNGWKDKERTHGTVRNVQASLTFANQRLCN